MAMGAITQTRIRATAVDFSYPYFIDHVGFITRKPSPVPKVLAIMWPYENITWVAFAMTLLAFNLVNWMVSRIYKEEFSPSFNLGQLVMQVCRLSVVKGN